jgi:hypothetical protein
MDQIYIKYTEWEDYKSGMYNLNNVFDKDIKVIGAIKTLSNPDLFYKACVKVEKLWPISCSVNLTNSSMNRKAWVGAACCMIENQCVEYLTRIAWGLLNNDKQIKANKIAETFIQEYERKNNTIHKDMGTKMLF